MKLSLWIIYDYLQKYHPVAHITEGKQSIRMVRVLSEQYNRGSSTVYLAKASDYFNSGSSQIICAHGHDFLLLDGGDLDEILNELLNCFDLYNGWSDSVAEMIQQGCSLQDIFDASSHIFSEALILVDASHFVLKTMQPHCPPVMEEEQKKNLAYFNRMVQDEMMPLKDIATARKKHQIYSLSREPYQVQHPVLNIPVLLRNLQHEGNIWGYIAEGYLFTTPTHGDAQILSELGNLLEYWIKENKEIGKSSTDFSTLFQKVLESGNVEDAENLELHLYNFNWLPDCRKQLYSIGSAKQDVGILSILSRRINQLEGYISNTNENRIMLLVNLDLANLSDTTQFGKMLRDAECFAVRSLPFTQISSLWQQRQPLKVAMRYCGREAGMIYEGYSYLLKYLLVVLRENSSIPFFHPVIATLLDFDQKNETQLVKTLYYYLLYERRYEQTAKTLFVHRNTVQYRIEKIVELTDIDLNDIEQRFYLLIALYFHFHQREVE